MLDSICRRLAALGVTLEFPGEPVLKKLANVQHLHTPVRVTLPESVRLLEVIGRLHPTPAVGGSPREAFQRRAVPSADPVTRNSPRGATARA